MNKTSFSFCLLTACPSCLLLCWSIFFSHSLTSPNRDHTWICFKWNGEPTLTICESGTWSFQEIHMRKTSYLRAVLVTNNFGRLDSFVCCCFFFFNLHTTVVWTQSLGDAGLMLHTSGILRSAPRLRNSRYLNMALLGNISFFFTFTFDLYLFYFHFWPLFNILLCDFYDF